jgi:hypothetical protein
MKQQQVKTENMKTDCNEKVSNIVNNPSMNQIIRNIRSWINELNTGPRIQNFAAAKLTSGMLREDAATITVISLRKINRGWQLCQTFDSSQLMFNQPIIRNRVTIEELQWIIC